MMKLRINFLVAKDLKSIKDFVAEDNADKALETVQKIYRQFENIQQFPYIGADLSKRVRFKTDYKDLLGNWVKNCPNKRSSFNIFLKEYTEELKIFMKRKSYLTRILNMITVCHIL